MTNIIEIICENLGGTVEVPMGTPLSEVAKRVAPCLLYTSDAADE